MPKEPSDQRSRRLMREAQRRYTERNRDKERARLRAHYAATATVKLAKNAAWDRANRDKRLAIDRRWKARNAEYSREAAREWHKQNRAASRAQGARRRASKVNATPAWADHAAIAKVYDEAKRLAAETGVLHHVDHIVPLKGRIVCGLHVHYNLRAIPAAENLAKGNRL